jgi:hypothetical protein
MYMYMNQEYSKLSIEEKPQNEIMYESLQSKESNNLPIDDKYSENIKNFITFLKLIDEKIN